MYFKNPIIWGVIATIVSYVYLYYQQKRKLEQESINSSLSINSNDVNLSNVKTKIELYKPIVVGLVTWFLVAQYFSSGRNVIETDGEYESSVSLSPMTIDDMEDLTNTFVPSMSGNTGMIFTDYR